VGRCEKNILDVGQHNESFQNVKSVKNSSVSAQELQNILWDDGTCQSELLGIGTFFIVRNSK
jgi:hypothetical protein